MKRIFYCLKWLSLKKDLLQNLFEQREIAIKEIVAAYKKRLADSPITSEEEFKSIRLKILSFLLNGDDCIHILKTAYAEWDEK